MRIFTRTKVALGATGLVLAIALQGFAPGHAQTNGALVPLSTDPVLTSTATGVTAAQAFPGGATTASCFVATTTTSGAQTATQGACQGITVTVTCSSNAFPTSSTPAPTTDQHGAAYVLNGTRTQAGIYDTGGPCAASSPPSGVTPTSAITVSGYTAGSTLVFYINNDAGTTTRTGCLVYYEGTTASTPACATTTPGSTNGAYYAVTATGTSGAFFQTKSAGSTTTLGNLTIGGVFIIPALVTGTATATATAGTPAATATAGTPTVTATAGTPTVTATAAAGGTPPPPPTFIPTPIGSPAAPPTNTPTVTPTPAATDTPTAAPTATAAVPTPTPKTPPKKTATPAPTATTAPTSPKPVSVRVKPTVPPTGGGGTYMYSSAGASKLSRAALTSQAPASLPQTGGGAGGNPTSPLAPLALLGAVAILAGRTVRRMRK